jgi:hypothetical protein
MYAGRIFIPHVNLIYFYTSMPDQNKFTGLVHIVFVSKGNGKYFGRFNQEDVRKGNYLYSRQLKLTSHYQYCLHSVGHNFIDFLV